MFLHTSTLKGTINTITGYGDFTQSVRIRSLALTLRSYLCAMSFPRPLKILKIKNPKPQPSLVRPVCIAISRDTLESPPNDPRTAIPVFAKEHKAGVVELC